MKTPEYYLIELAKAHDDAMLARNEYRKFLREHEINQSEISQLIEQGDEKFLKVMNDKNEKNKRLWAARQKCIRLGRKGKQDEKCTLKT